MVKPKILIIGTHRSGTSNLTITLAKTFRSKALGEPWNEWLNRERLGPGIEPYPYPDGIVNFNIVKTLSQQVPLTYTKSSVEFNVELSTYFDKVILLTRKDINEMALSYAKACERSLWHSEYVIRETDNLDLNIPMHTQARNMLYEIAEKLDLPITWYEELYSGDKFKFTNEVNKWNLDINIDSFFNHFDPKNRYRKFTNKQTSI